MGYGIALAIAVGLGLPLAVCFASFAQAKAASTALESIAKQPEAAGRIQTAMIIGLALIESLVIYVLLSFFLLNGKVANVADVVENAPVQEIVVLESGTQVSGSLGRTTTRTRR